MAALWYTPLAVLQNRLPCLELLAAHTGPVPRLFRGLEKAFLEEQQLGEGSCGSRQGMELFLSRPAMLLT
jgi:hypothetical protein